MKQRWEIKTLGEVCRIIAGGDVPKNEFSKTHTTKYNVPIFSNGEKDDGLYGYTSITKISQPSITVSARGTIGFPVKRTEGFYPVIRLIVLTPNNYKQLNLDYLYYTLKSIDFIHSGSSIPQLTVPMIKDNRITIPPIDEQERIVGVLDSAFAKIEALRANAQQNLQNTKDLFQALLKQELTPKQGWTSESVKDLSKDIFAGGDAPQDNFSEYRTDKYNIPIYANAVKDDGFYGYTDFARVTEPSLTIAARGSGTGYVLERKEAYLPIVRLIVIIPKQEQIQLRYLYYSFKGLDITRSGSAIPQLTIPMIRNYTISFPLIAEQTSIVEKLDALSERCRAMEENYRQTIAHCNALKQALLTKAFNGEL